MQCYDVAKDKPKFLSLFGVQDLTAPSSSSSGSSDKDEGTAIPAKRPSSTSVGNKSSRPVGTKKAKKMKQEDEMAERMAKKFGLATTTMEDKNHGGGKSSGLHEALAKFVGMAGQSMSTWMLQSMSPSASKDLRHQYADECIRKKILKMRARNAAMERMVHDSSKTPTKCKTTNKYELVAINNLLNLCTTTSTKETDEDEKEEGIYSPPPPHTDDDLPSNEN